MYIDPFSDKLFSSKKMNSKVHKKDKLFIDIAKRFAEESHCSKIKVCALAVKEDRIICTGINGTLPGEINCDDYFKIEYKKSKKYFPDMSINRYLSTVDYKNCHHEWALVNEVHAEENLCGIAAKLGISLKDSTIYTTFSPCISCSKLLATTGIKRIVYLNEYDKGNKDSFNLLKNQGIEVVKFEEK